MLGLDPGIHDLLSNGWLRSIAVFGTRSVFIVEPKEA
jgi:hypothetical protein